MGTIAIDKTALFRDAVQQILTECAEYAMPQDNISFNTVFDTTQDHYMLVVMGWYGHERVYNCLMHLDIIDQKIWVQHNNTEFTLTEDFERFGISKSDVINGQIPAYRREMLENQYAPATFNHRKVIA